MIAAILLFVVAVFFILLQAAWSVAMLAVFVSLALAVSMYVHLYSALNSFMGGYYWGLALIGSLVLGTLFLRVLVMALKSNAVAKPN